MMPAMTCRFCLFGMVCVFMIVAGPVTTLDAIPVPPQRMPVSKLLAHLNARVTTNPNDVQAVFTLGRVHYFAFAGGTDILNVYGADSANPTPYDALGPYGKGTSAYDRKVVPIVERERVAHLKNAISYLRRAVTLHKPGARSDGRYELCLASAYQDGAPYAAEVGVIDAVEATPRAWIEAAIHYHGLAFDAASERDGQVKMTPIFGVETLVSYEAGREYQRLLLSRGAPSSAEQERLARVQALVAHAKALKPGAITPLIFSVGRDVDLPALLSPRIAAFDLNGTQLPQRYRWVRPDTGILVWDPHHTGAITSGRQMFGSVTWWMFWDDGYQPLAVLDEDANGWVDGAELADLGVWFDRDENGRSSPREVVPVANTEISAIAVFPTDRDGAVRWHRRGLRLKDGRELPTYDWVATPVLPTSTVR
jgi:hypothetical protein